MTAWVLLVALTLSILVTPFVAVAQPAGKVAKIGFLMSGSATAMTRNVEAFTQVLRELGYIEGQNMAIEQRYDEGESERLPVLAAELVSLKIEVCVVNTNRVAEAVQQTTTPIPIVMTTAKSQLLWTCQESGASWGYHHGGGGHARGGALWQEPGVADRGPTQGHTDRGALQPHRPSMPSGCTPWRRLPGVGGALVPAGVRRVEDFAQALAVMQHANARGVVVLMGDPLFGYPPNRSGSTSSPCGAGWPPCGPRALAQSWGA